MQQTPKWLKDLIKWFPTGIGGAATGHFAIAQQWKEAVLSSMVTAGLSLWAKFSTGFMEELEKGVNERGKKSALYRYRAGIPWRDLPERFGDFRVVHTRWVSVGKAWCVAKGI